ncbi:MAG TPA: MlaD family protein [Nevskiaceae bacterium]
METKAHHVLIGAFTVVVVAAALLAALWLGNASLSRQFHYYDIVFTEAVTGLSRSSTVQFNGIKVGEVSGLKIDEQDPHKIRVRIQVAADTPVKQDTRAELGLQGITGNALVQLTGSTAQSPPLVPTDSDPVPVIPSESSTLTKLLSSGTDVVTSLNLILNRLTEVLSHDNVARLDHTLENFETLSAALAARSGDLETLIHQSTLASQHLSQTLAGTDALVNGPARETVEQANAAMATLNRTTQTLDELLQNNADSLQSGVRGMSQIGPTMRELRVTLRELRRVTDRLAANPSGYLLGRGRPTEFTPGKH